MEPINLIDSILLALVGFCFISMSFAMILSMIGMWKLFQKADRPRWGALIPFYNAYLLFDIVWGNGYLSLLLLIPIGNIIIGIATGLKMAKAYGQRTIFGVGMIFFPMIFMLILAYGKSKYVGPVSSNNRKYVIITCLIGVIYLIFTCVSLNNLEIQQEIPIIEEKEIVKENQSVNELVTEDMYDYVQLDNGDIQIEIPMLQNDNLYTSDSFSSSLSDGVEIKIQLDYTEFIDFEETLNEFVERNTTLYDSLDYYTDIRKEEVLRSDDWILQQINYNYQVGDTLYPCFDIYKVEECNGYPLLIRITVDNSQSTSNTENVLNKACELYGVDFQVE